MNDFPDFMKSKLNAIASRSLAQRLLLLLLQQQASPTYKDRGSFLSQGGAERWQRPARPTERQQRRAWECRPYKEGQWRQQA